MISAVEGADSPSGLRRRSLLEGVVPIRHLAWSPKGSMLVAGFVDGELRVWNPADGGLRWGSRADRRPVDHLAWSPSGRRIASVDSEAVRIWEAATGRLLRSFETPSQRTAGVAWSPDSQRITVARVVGQLPAERLVFETWNPTNGKRLDSLADPAWDRCYVGMSADRRHLALALTSGIVQVWNLGSCKLLGAVPAGHREAKGLALSPDKSLLVLAFTGGTVAVWDLRRRERLRALSENERTVYSLAFSSDGKILAGKSRDGTVRLWSCKTWERAGEIHEWSSQREEVEVTFDPRKPQLATFERTNTCIRIWELNMNDFEISTYPVLRILFLAADPFTSRPRLHLDQELRWIREELDRARLWDHFQIRDELAVRPADLSRTLLDQRPHIVHFSGHGNRAGAIFVEDPNGQPHPISARALAKLFKLAADHVRCVVLNACYSHPQAQAIAKKIEYVIGMKQQIGDPAAIAFAAGFYKALGGGRPIVEAYDYGCVEVDLLNLPDYSTPVLWKKGKPVKRIQE